jgi:hypothetical protein
VPEVLGDNPSLQEILWNFSRFKDEKKRLTLSENPYFYAQLPTSPGAYGVSFRLDPTEDFRSTNEFYVLTDSTGPVRILTGLPYVYKFWCLENAFIFKGLSILFFFPRF